MTLIEQMHEAVDDMDDFAAMADIDPIGTRKVLLTAADRLEQADRLIEELESAVKNTAEMDVNGYALIDRLRFSPKGREIMNQINEALASAKLFKEGT